MIYYKKCTILFPQREITYENFQGKTEHQWRNYLVKDLKYNLNSADLLLSNPVIPEDKLISVPRRIR